jgi:DNA repair exonuclease SbcCD ATPase subunit
MTMTSEELQTLVEDLKIDLERASKAKEAYQQAWKDEIDKRQAAERMMRDLREALETAMNVKRHVTKDDLREILGLPPLTGDGFAP